MPFQLRKEHLPWGMAAARAALGPILIAGQACNWSGVALASLVLSALLSDIFDGARLFDSMADTFFYLCVGIALCIGQPQLWRSNTGLICALLAAEAAKFAFDFAKFGKPSLPLLAGKKLGSPAGHCRHGILRRPSRRFTDSGIADRRHCLQRRGPRHVHHSPHVAPRCAQPIPRVEDPPRNAGPSSQPEGPIPQDRERCRKARIGNISRRPPRSVIVPELLRSPNQLRVNSAFYLHVRARANSELRMVGLQQVLSHH
jgi:hypothetical protein